MIYIYYCLIITLISISNLTAQHQNQDETLTLDRAISYALRNSTNIARADLLYRGSKYNQLYQLASLFPTINSSISGSSNTGKQFNQVTGEFVDETVSNIGGGINVNMPLFDGFSRWYNIRQALYDKKSAYEQLEYAKETVVFRTLSAYLRVIVTEELVKVRQENFETEKKLLEQISEQVKIGLKPEVDLYNQQASIANAELLLTQQQHILDISKLELLNIMQIDANKEYDFVIPSLEWDEEQILDNNDYDFLVNTALANRHDVKQIQYNLQAQRYRHKNIKSNLWPSLNMGFNLSSNYNDALKTNTGSGLEAVPFGKQFFDQNISYSFRLSLSIPIFNNFSTQANIQQSRFQVRNIELNLKDKELSITQEVLQAYNSYKNYLKQVESTSQALKASESSYNAQKERYDVGTATLTELQQARASYINAQSNHIQNQYNLTFQRKLTLYYLGILDINKWDESS